MSAFVYCPECDARIRRSESSAPGGRVRCASCGTVFRAPAEYARDEEEDSGSARRQIERTRPSNQGVLIGVLVGGAVVVVLACAGLVGALFWVLSSARPQADKMEWQPAAVEAQGMHPLELQVEEEKEDYAEARKHFQTKLLQPG